MSDRNFVKNHFFEFRGRAGSWELKKIEINIYFFALCISDMAEKYRIKRNKYLFLSNFWEFFIKVLYLKPSAICKYSSGLGIEYIIDAFYVLKVLYDVRL